MPMSRN